MYNLKPILFVQWRINGSYPTLPTEARDFNVGYDDVKTRGESSNVGNDDAPVVSQDLQHAV